MIASEINLNHTTVRHILIEELAMKKIVWEDCSQKRYKHDNTPCQMVIPVIELLPIKGIPVVQQPR
jgi:hypothetical protein